MKFSAAAVIAAAATGAAAWSGSNVTVTTDVVTAYTTYCPEATKITMGNKTYTVTSASTLTITDCPCTITRPCTTSSAAWNATSLATSAPAPTAPSTAPSTLPTAGAGKAAVLSGAGLAGLVGLAAFAL